MTEQEERRGQPRCEIGRKKRRVWRRPVEGERLEKDRQGKGKERERTALLFHHN